MDILNTKIKSILTEKGTKIIPANIKSGVNILGINGSLVELNGETKTVTPTTSQQTITPGTGKNALTQVTINAVSNTIDNNITEENIKNGVTILGISGTYEGIITQQEYNEDEELARSILQDFKPYTQVQYIESTGEQYINTGYYPNEKTKIDLVMEAIDWGDFKTAFGVRTGVNTGGTWVYTKRFATWLYANKSNILQIGDDSRIVYETNRVYSNTKFNLIIDNGNIYIKDLINDYAAEESTFTPVTQFTTDYPLLLGAITNNGTTILNLCKFKLYSCKLYDDNVLVKDFIPVTNKLNNRACLYDKISKTFLYNPGSGDFVAGGVV